KMELLKELLLQTLDSGHRVLLFSQFTSLLAIVRKFLEENEIPYEYLDGSTKDRFAHVDRFNNSKEIPVFLLSLKAGGLGLNLTSADTVILYDPWWNPTAEAQAMDRSHRIGQTRKVNCVKLIVKDSVEEKVLELQKSKQDLFRDVVENSTEGMRSLSLEDFEFLLS
ncbi:MAG: SWF/SNF helicase family protein, partial [Lentisphaeria bacterium]|nr:SWF/SNF helicase family protein [Lentisphaeria bacterium]